MANDNAAMEALEGALAGYGSGIAVNTVFQAASGAVITLASILSGTLVLVLTGVFFGIGLVHGHRKDRRERLEADARDTRPTQ
jgi:hypothetical protein